MVAPRGQRILVTGSARLDFYRYGGDSLQGRYHLLRLHPLSVAELGVASPGGLKDLLVLGGFPEPFFGGSETQARRWSREYRQRLVREDVTSLERVQDLGSLETLMLRLPDLVGSPLSLNALREDIQVSHRTVAGWMAMLERLYATFRLPPFGAPRIRAVKKEQKHYHFDWTLVPGDAQRFENLVASHLLKWVHFREDSEGRDLELQVFPRPRRPRGGLRRGRGAPADDCWSSASGPTAEVDRSLRYLKQRFPDADAWQVSRRGRQGLPHARRGPCRPGAGAAADLV